MTHNARFVLLAYWVSCAVWFGAGVLMGNMFSAPAQPRDRVTTLVCEDDSSPSRCVQR